MSPKKATKTSKKLPAAPLAGREAKKTKKSHPFFEATPKDFRIGGDIRPQADLSRFMRWPKYIRIQRQRRILMQRLKVPPALNQFNCTLDRNQSSQLIKFLAKYKPETKMEKKKRLIAEAEKREAGQPLTSKKPVMLKFGINHVTELVEMKKAKLCVIANDVEPIELVCWLPALCRKKDVPYCIVKGKSRLGQLVHQKNSCAVVVDNIKKEDQGEFEAFCRNFRAQYNDNAEIRRRWGGGIMGIKSQHKLMKREKAAALEQAKKLGLGSA